MGESEALITARQTAPIGYHRPRVDDRKAMDATGICSGSSVHRRFQEWTQAGVFKALWVQDLLSYEGLKGIEWEWQAMDGAMTKAPLGKEQPDPNPTDRAKRGVKRSILVDGHGFLSV